jgi:hypothetical protein
MVKRKGQQTVGTPAGFNRKMRAGLLTTRVTRLLTATAIQPIWPCPSTACIVLGHGINGAGRRINPHTLVLVHGSTVLAMYLPPRFLKKMLASWPRDSRWELSRAALVSCLEDILAPYMAPHWLLFSPAKGCRSVAVWISRPGAFSRFSFFHACNNTYIIRHYCSGHCRAASFGQNFTDFRQDDQPAGFCPGM